MSDMPKNYSLCDTNDYGNSSPHKLASPPKPAPRTMPRSMTHKSNKSKESELYRGGGPPPPRYSDDDLPQSPFHSFQQHNNNQINNQQQQQQQHQYHTRPYTTLLAGPHQYKPCQSVKPSTSEPRRDHSHRNGDNYHPLPAQSESKDQARFFEEVAAKLQALKNDGASKNSKHHFDMSASQAERSHDVLDTHFNNHFTINNHKSSRIPKKSRTIKAYCTYVEFDGAKKIEITSYLLKPKSNTLYDLKRTLPSRSEGIKLFFKNQDNVLEQADYDDHPLHTFKDKDGHDIIMCEIVVPKTVVPCLN